MILAFKCNTFGILEMATVLLNQILNISTKVGKITKLSWLCLYKEMVDKRLIRNPQMKFKWTIVLNVSFWRQQLGWRGQQHKAGLPNMSQTFLINLCSNMFGLLKGLMEFSTTEKSTGKAIRRDNWRFWILNVQTVARQRSDLKERLFRK